MRSIDEIRKEIDKVDEELVRLIIRRIELVREIAIIKMRDHIKLVNPSREDEVLIKVRDLSSELGVNPDNMELLFRVIMMICLKEEIIRVEECGNNWRCREDG